MGSCRGSGRTTGVWLASRGVNVGVCSRIKTRLSLQYKKLKKDKVHSLQGI